MPDLAAAIEPSDDGRTYRFPLRANARFHDGSEVTAADVKRSIERALAPTTPAPYASFFDSIEGFDDYVGTRAAPRRRDRRRALPGRHPPSRARRGVPPQARAHRPPRELRQRQRPLLPVVGPLRRRPLSRASWRLGAGELAHRRAPRGILPPGGVPTSTRWPGSFTRHSSPRGSSSPAATSIPSGISRSRPRSATRRTLAGGRSSAYDPAHVIQGEAMNAEVPPFDNVEIRRAVAAAIDRDHLALLRSSSFAALTRPVPPGLAGYDPPPVGQRHDLAAALAHMKKAGYPFDPATRQGGWPARIPYDVFKQGIFEFSGAVDPAGPREDRHPHRAPRLELPHLHVPHAPAGEVGDELTAGVERGLPRSEQLSRGAVLEQEHQRRGLRQPGLLRESGARRAPRARAARGRSRGADAHLRGGRANPVRRRAVGVRVHESPLPGEAGVRPRRPSSRRLAPGRAPDVARQGDGAARASHAGAVLEGALGESGTPRNGGR